MPFSQFPLSLTKYVAWRSTPEEAHHTCLMKKCLDPWQRGPVVAVTSGLADPVLSSTPGALSRITGGQHLLLNIHLPENLPGLCLLPIAASLGPQAP